MSTFGGFSPLLISTVFSNSISSSKNTSSAGNFFLNTYTGLKSVENSVSVYVKGYL